jgi:hypothetical protein
MQRVVGDEDEEEEEEATRRIRDERLGQGNNGQSKQSKRK